MCNDKQTIKIVRGTTNSFSVAITDKETGDPYELSTGEFLRFGVKLLPTDTTYILEKTISEADENDKYTFVIDPSDTINLSFGSYWYDIGLQSGSAYYNIISASPFELAYNITKWGA